MKWKKVTKKVFCGQFSEVSNGKIKYRELGVRSGELEKSIKNYLLILKILIQTEKVYSFQFLKQIPLTPLKRGNKTSAIVSTT